MNAHADTVTVNGVELAEGDDLWRYKGLRTWQATIGSQDPDAVLAEVAEQLVENYPEAVEVEAMPEGDDPVAIVHANLRANPGIYDDTDLIRYHAMEVRRVSTSHGTTEVTIKDWKEEKKYAFNSERDEVEEGAWATFEPLSALEDHLGVTILPVEE